MRNQVFKTQNGNKPVKVTSLSTPKKIKYFRDIFEIKNSTPFDSP
jgi:hypothetical protein